MDHKLNTKTKSMNTILLNSISHFIYRRRNKFDAPHPHNRISAPERIKRRHWIRTKPPGLKFNDMNFLRRPSHF